MTIRTLFGKLLARWEGSFERAMRDDLRGPYDDERAHGEFISTLIIDHGASGRSAESADSRGMPRG